MDEETWMEDENHPAVADVGGPVGSDPSGSSDGFRPSPKLRARIEELAKWRMDPASISLGNGSVYHGGHATVSKGTVEREITWGRTRNINIAVKKMRLADDTDLERVLGLTIREAEFLVVLDHPNIVKLGGFVEDVSKGTVWLVFPWAEYGNLKDFIAREKWDIPEKISLISDVAKGLEYLHTRNPPICHGDLKSLNVLIYNDSDGSGGWRSYWLFARKIYARITDFGSARRLLQRDPDTRVEELVTQLPSAQQPSTAFCASTKTITLTGNRYTLRWAAPELLLQDQLGLWSDIWALGWIAYEVMTESLPFEDVASEIAVVKCVVEGKLPSLTDNAHLLLINELCSLMNMCWKPQPTQRPTAYACRKSIEKMPMFAIEMRNDERVLGYDRLRKVGQMYQSRGEYARAFAFFANSTTGRFQLEHRVQSLRDLAQLARLRKEYSETIAVYDVIWEIYEETDRKDEGGLSGAFNDLAELHRLRNEREEIGELHFESQRLQGPQRIATALCAMAENHRREGTHDQAIELNANALKISTELGDMKGRADALRGSANVHRRRSEYEKAILLYSEVLEIRTDLNDRKGRADALWGLADVHRRRSEYEKAIPLYYEVSQIRTDLNDRKGGADALWGLADVHRRRSEYEEAIPLYDEVSQIRADLNNRKGRADALWGLADVHRRRSEYEKAILLYSEVLEICTELNDRKGRADALWGLADVRRRRSEYEEAGPFYSEVLKIRTDLNDTTGRADALWGLADLYRRRSKYDWAIWGYSQALEIFTDLNDRKGRADALWGLADVHRRRSEYEKAILLHSEVLEICTELKNRKGRADALWGLADVRRRRSEYEVAGPLYSEVLKIRTDLNDSEGRADALWFFADVCRRRGEYEEAIPLYSEVLKICTDRYDREGRADALWGLADVHRRRSEYDKAIPLYSEILKMGTYLDSSKSRVAALWGLADVYRSRRELAKVIPLYLELLEIAYLDDRVEVLLSLTLARPQEEYGEAISILLNALRSAAADDERVDRLLLRVSNGLVGRFGSQRLTGELPTETRSGGPTLEFRSNRFT